jgi:opacity protein-like surface antigen
MKQTLLLVLLFLLSLQVSAQDKKWSLEANYPISIGNQIGNDNNAIIDLGLKYRFADFNIVRLGAGLNASVFHKNNPNLEGSNTGFKETNYFIQPKLFAEFSIPKIKKLKPSIGLGYTIITSSLDGTFLGEDITGNSSDGGFNLNLGLSYDVSKNLFIQVQYDYINQKIENRALGLEGNRSIELLKIGLGFRF